MRYDQVDLALTFLEEPRDRIVLQVGFTRDLDLVRRHVGERLGNPILMTRRLMDYGDRGCIHFETVSDMAGHGWGCPCFLIERLDGMLPASVEYA